MISGYFSALLYMSIDFFYVLRYNLSIMNILDETVIDANPFTRLNVYCPAQPPHGHTFFEFALVLNGTCKHSMCGGPLKELKHGALVLIRPGEYHEISFSGKDCLYRDYYATVDAMKNICNAIGENFYQELTSRKEPYITNLSVDEFNAISHKSSLFNGTNPISGEQAAHLSQLHKTIIIELLGCFIAKNITGNGAVPDWLNDLYMHLTYFDYIYLSIDEIIAKTGYSHSYVSQMFKKHFNTSIIAYHNKNKVTYSCKMLGNMKIIDIATMLGWENPKNYTIEFRKIFGCSPTQYLKNGKKQNII